MSDARSDVVELRYGNRTASLPRTLSYNVSCVDTDVVRKVSIWPDDITNAPI